MSKLEEMLRELCPDGVKYSSIGSIITRVREKAKDNPDISQVYAVSNTQGMVRAEDYRENTIHSEDTSNYTVVRENMVAYNPSRLNIGSIARLKYSEAGLVSPMYVVFSIDESQMRYGYFDYLIKSSYVAGKINSLKEEGARFRFDFSRWDWISIPIPPLEIQDEIVRILDKFTTLTAELTAELTARQKQYDYYRDRLFDIGCEVLPITTIAHTYIGLVTTMTKHYVPHGVKLIHNSNVKVNRFEFKENTYLDEAFANQNSSRRHRIGDIITVHTGDVGTSAIIDEELDGSLGFATIVSRIYDDTIITPMYLCYYFNSRRNKQNIASMIKGDRNNLNLKDFNQLKVPVPSLETQHRIVSILDRFDTLCNDLSSGLPAEIEARKKQYEYYRDKLLTFREV